MSAAARPQFEPAIGRYLRLDIQGKPHDCQTRRVSWRFGAAQSKEVTR